MSIVEFPSQVGSAALLAAAVLVTGCVSGQALPEPGTPQSEYRHVVITLGDGEADPRCGADAQGAVDVKPFWAHIFHPGIGNRPRQVRWVVRGLARGDVLTIRPAKGESESLFLPEKRGTFRVPGGFSSIDSGLPNDPEFSSELAYKRLEDRTGAARPHEINAEGEVAIWDYEIEVLRGEERLYFCDPEVMVDKDG